MAASGLRARVLRSVIGTFRPDFLERARMETFGQALVALAEPGAHDVVGISGLLHGHQRTARLEAHDIADLELRHSQEKLHGRRVVLEARVLRVVTCKPLR